MPLARLHPGGNVSASQAEAQKQGGQRPRAYPPPVVFLPAESCVERPQQNSQKDGDEELCGHEDPHRVHGDCHRKDRCQPNPGSCRASTRDVCLTDARRRPCAQGSTVRSHPDRPWARRGDGYLPGRAGPAPRVRRERLRAPAAGERPPLPAGLAGRESGQPRAGRNEGHRPLRHQPAASRLGTCAVAGAAVSSRLATLQRRRRRRSERRARNDRLAGPLHPLEPLSRAVEQPYSLGRAVRDPGGACARTDGSRSQAGSAECARRLQRGDGAGEPHDPAPDSYRPVCHRRRDGRTGARSGPAPAADLAALLPGRLAAVVVLVSARSRLTADAGSVRPIPSVGPQCGDYRRSRR